MLIFPNILSFFPNTYPLILLDKSKKKLHYSSFYVLISMDESKKYHMFEATPTNIFK